jgi:allantoicase
MDGWESRRKRVAGHDWCIVRLARPARVHGIDLDTSHFTGNYPPAASIDACNCGEGDAGADSDWSPLLRSVDLAGNRHHYVAIDDDRVITHLRINLYPDGGLARLRIYGTPQFDATTPDADGLFDLASALHGGTVVASNNEHFGPASALLLPGRGINMGDGWETRRRREPGNDWCLIALARPGVIEAVEVDTAHFKGNYPDRCSLQAACVAGGTAQSLITQAMFWPVLLPEQKLQMDQQHYFSAELAELGIVTHVRLNIFPDGGVSRLRLRGRPA